MRAIVTGSTSGIGLACLQRLLAEGADVVGMDVVPPKTTCGPKYVHLECDLADVDAVRAAVDKASERLGQIDALLHFGALFSTVKWDASEGSGD